MKPIIQTKLAYPQLQLVILKTPSLIPQDFTFENSLDKVTGKDNEMFVRFSRV